MFMAPPSTPWTDLQNMNKSQHGPIYSQFVENVRREHRRTFLDVCKKAFLAQHAGGRDGYIEQPWNALSWATPELSALEEDSVDAIVDQCRYGLSVRDKEGKKIGPARKKTRILLNLR